MTKIGESGHQRAFLIALIAVGAALVLSVVSFANTSTSSTVVVTVGGVGGAFGFSVGQGTPATAVYASDNGDTVTVEVADSNFAVGDYILIDADGDDDPSDLSTHSYHTVTAVNSATLTVVPNISNIYTSSASVVEQAPNAAPPTWSPSVGSTSSITGGNYFLINLQGVATTDSALVEIFLTNPDALVKNYTFLHRLMNVQVLCESSGCPNDPGTTPFSISGTNGVWQDAVDAAGTKVSETPDYLTLTNARQAFILLGGYTYALTIDGGTLFTIDVTENQPSDSLSPIDLVQLTAL